MDDDRKWPFPSERNAAVKAAADILTRRLEVAERMAQALREWQVIRLTMPRYVVADLEPELLATDSVLAEWEATKP